jgi:hypothetical protein
LRTDLAGSSPPGGGGRHYRMSAPPPSVPPGLPPPPGGEDLGPTEMGPTLRPAPLASFGVPGDECLFHRFTRTTDRGDASRASGRVRAWLAPKHWPPVPLKGAPAEVPCCPCPRGGVQQVLSHPDARRIGSACFGTGVPGRRVVSLAAWSGRLGGCGRCGRRALGSGDPSGGTFAAVFSLRAGRSGYPWHLAIGTWPLALGRVPGTSFLAPARLCRMPEGLRQGDEVRRERCCFWASGPVRLPVRLRGSFSFGLAVPRAGIVSDPRT